jgi:hypothetical protein
VPLAQRAPWDAKLQQSVSTLHAAPLAEHVIAEFRTQCLAGGLVAMGTSRVQLAVPDD